MTGTTAADAAAQRHGAGLKNADGSWRFTNALVHETSPYLLQHAHNPVDWHPWGEEAFELARRTGRPIFLSVGYSTCYWCHVMERRVFENPALAALLNRHFVSIKVDREERPDVDEIYMTAVQVMTGQGGWPMSVFLTPPGAGGEGDRGLKPFWAGTYIPPEPGHGMPGFGQVVEGLAGAWRERRGEVVGQAEQVAEAVRHYLGRSHGGGGLGPELVRDAANRLVREYDAENGGFGTAPKFPQPAALAFLMKVYRNNPNAELWSALAYTLERMARGGVYDQVGGGFHRYSTDGAWLVPHFEKMLYDNAQLIEVYLTAHEIAPDEKDPQLYSRVVRETCDYVLREMTPGGAGGAFWSAQDAEVEAREGGNYVWTADEVRGVIGATGWADAGEMAGLAERMYGLDRGPNFRDPHDPGAGPVNVLYLPVRLDALAEGLGVSLEELVDARRRINGALLGARDRRPRPMTDDKALASWNGMMIAAMARAGRVLGVARYTGAAEAAAEQVLGRMRDAERPGGLLRTMRGGRAKTPAFLEDYAHLAHGLIELHRATGERRWLDEAAALVDTAAGLFSARAERGGGYYDTLPDQADLFVRTVSTYDGAVPSGNSQMVHDLIDLYEATGERAYLVRAVRDLGAFSSALAERGPTMVHMEHALLRALEIDSALVRAGGGRSGGRVEGGPVRVSASVGEVDAAAGPVRFSVTVEVGDGYHINAAVDAADGAVAPGLIATSLELRGGAGLKVAVAYPEPAERRYPFADRALRVYEGTVVLDVTLERVGGGGHGARPGRPALVLRYQACTESACLEPAEVEVPITIKTAGR